MATLRDVAQNAGVSVCTVSQILNPTGRERRFSPECRKRVLRAADELGYRPNYHARSLNRGRAGAIGVLTGSGDTPVGSWFWGPLVGGIDRVARNSQLDLVVVGPRREQSIAQVALQHLRERRVDALIAPAGLTSPLDELPAELHGEPIVLIDSPGNSPFPVVSMDPAPGMSQAASHLHDLGHREIAWVGFADGSEGSRPPRLRALRAACRKLGMRLIDSDVTRLNGATDVSTAAAHVGSLLDRRSAPPTALVCYNEHAALGAVAAIQRRGLRVPEDISVVGFDDLFGELSDPPLTTVSHMLHEVGARAAEVAIEMSSSPRTRKKMKGARFGVASRLVIRKSTGNAPSRA